MIINSGPRVHTRRQQDEQMFVQHSLCQNETLSWSQETRRRYRGTCMQMCLCTYTYMNCVHERRQGINSDTECHGTAYSRLKHNDYPYVFSSVCWDRHGDNTPTAHNCIYVLWSTGQTTKELINELTHLRTEYRAEAYNRTAQTLCTEHIKRKEAKRFLSLHRVWTGPTTHLDSCQMDKKGSLPHRNVWGACLCTQLTSVLQSCVMPGKHFGMF
jgi:hypothetical protein